MKSHAFTLILKLTDRLALNIQGSSAHWNSTYGKVQHGPQVWPWWLLFSLSLVKLEVGLPSTGKRLWLYTRWGAFYLDFVLDRRGYVSKRVQGWISSWNY